MMKFAPSSRAGSAWEKASPKDFLSKVCPRLNSQVVHVGSLEVNDVGFLGGSLSGDQNRRLGRRGSLSKPRFNLS